MKEAFDPRRATVEQQESLIVLRGRLKGHVEMLAHTIGPRSYEEYPESLERAATFLEETWQEQGYDVRRQTYLYPAYNFLRIPMYKEGVGVNLEVTMRGREKPEEIVVIGAHYVYDAVIVHGGGLRQLNSGAYYPTDYTDTDDFGMLGGGMRVAAALEMYLNQQAITFAFTGGVTRKNIAKFGSDCPTEAEVYADKFLRLIDIYKKRDPAKFENLEEPKIFLEDRSTYTKACVRNVLEMARVND